MRSGIAPGALFPGAYLTRALAALPVAVALLACAGSAQAAPFLAPEDHSFPAPEVDATRVQSAFAANGFAAVAWIETLTAGQSRVDVSLRAPGGEWSSPQQLPPETTINHLSLAVNAAGAAAVAWQETNRLAVARRPAGGAFGTPETAEDGIAPQVGIDAAGNVTLLYGLNNSAPEPGEVVRTAPFGGALLAAMPHTLSTTCYAEESSLAVAPSGEAIAGFGCDSMSFALRKGGTWGTTTTPFESDVANECVPNETFFSEPRTAIDGGGDPVGIVERTDRENECPAMGGSNDSEVNSAVLAIPSGGLIVAGPKVAQSGVAFGAGTPIPESVEQPAVAIGGGSVFTSWASAGASGFGYQILTRTYPANGAGLPTEPQSLDATAALALEDSISAGADGSALLTWSALPTSGTRSIMAAFAPTGGSFGAPVQVSDGSSEADFTSSTGDQAGDAVISWLQVAGSSHVVHARGFEATPPTLGAVAIPAGAQVGQAASFSSQASAVWGPVSFSWNFGDGTATGAQAAHTFLAAGPHTVTLTATTAAGSMSAGATVAVSGSPAAATGLVISALRQSAKRWREGKKLAVLSRAAPRPPVGTTFSFSLNLAATVRLQFTQPVAGHVVGHKCSTAKTHRAKAKRCTLELTRGTLGFAGHAGSDRISFQGRISKARKLRPGRYTVLLSATGAGLKSKPVSLTFTILP